MIPPSPSDLQLAAPGTLAAEFNFETDTSIPGKAASNPSPRPAQANPRIDKVVPRGLEPRTLRLLAVRSNQLSYETN